MEIELIEKAYQEGEFDSKTFSCPDCYGIDDDQYCCTTCWCTPDTTFYVEDAIKTLLDEIERLKNK